jgi:hypothetical protein
MKCVSEREAEKKRGGSSFPRLFTSSLRHFLTSSLPHLITSFLLLLTSIPALACDICQKNQPAPLRGITHGTGPQGAWDMPIIWCAVAIVGITLVLAVKMLVRPGERQADHIKQRILHDGL